MRRRSCCQCGERRRGTVAAVLLALSIAISGCASKLVASPPDQKAFKGVPDAAKLLQAPQQRLSRGMTESVVILPSRNTEEFVDMLDRCHELAVQKSAYREVTGKLHSARAIASGILAETKKAFGSVRTAPSVGQALVGSEQIVLVIDVRSGSTACIDDDGPRLHFADARFEAAFLTRALLKVCSFGFPAGFSDMPHPGTWILDMYAWQSNYVESFVRKFGEEMRKCM